MAQRKKTIRRLPPKTREIAKIINDVESVLHRLKNRLPQIAQFERDSMALYTAQDYLKNLTAEPKTTKSEAVVTESLFPDDNIESKEGEPDNAQEPESNNKKSKPDKQSRRRQSMEEKSKSDIPPQEATETETNQPDSPPWPESELNNKVT